MNKFFTLLFLGSIAFTAKAQTAPSAQPYGKIDQADLEMKACDFEKDANAEVLIDKGKVYFGSDVLVFEHHTRTKIFNDNGKGEANVRIEFYGGNHAEWISNIQAETINLNNGAIEITKVDKKQIYTQVVDQEISAIVFSFPNVKPGSVIEFKYTVETESAANFPDWYFQGSLPTRYSEFTSTVPDDFHYKNLLRVNQPFIKNDVTDHGATKTMALANIPSLSTEPYMTAKTDNLQCLLTQLLSISGSGSALDRSFSPSWAKIGEDEVGFDNFGGQFGRKLTGEAEILSHAKGLKSPNEKIAYIFNYVKDAMKWNEIDSRYTIDGTAKAWDKKIGNSTEINLMVYHLLNRAGITAYPLLVSTRKHGKVNPAYPSRYEFNRAVTYVPVDSSQTFVLDATNKYNIYNVIPYNLLNTFGLSIDKDNKKYDMTFIQNELPVRNVVFVNADVKAGGKMEGTVQISNASYNRIDCIENYKTNGEKKYIDYLRDDNNDLKISSVKFENMETDSLPLTQNINFNLDLTGSDDTYIYFKPNLFTGMGNNPFLSEKRGSDIDFGYRNNYIIVGSYKIPSGFKSDALPKSVKMEMSDQSISFKRVVSEQEGAIMVKYTITYQKALFFKENYLELHDFYKKMYELINEQIVLKKS